MTLPPVGQIPRRALISNVTNATRCQVTTIGAHGFTSRDFIRITDLDGCMPIRRGMDELNNNLYRIVVDSDTTFLLQDPTTFDYIDSTLYAPYVTGGRCNLDNHTYIFHPPIGQDGQT